MFSFADIQFKIFDKGGVFGYIDCHEYYIFVAMNVYSRGGKQGLWQVVVFPDKNTKKPLRLKCFQDKTYSGNLSFNQLQQQIFKIQEELKNGDTN